MNKKIPIEALKKNPDNPRIIKDDKFRKLVESVKSFPEMLELRPIVVNSEMMILGGNMRFAACKEAGLKEVPVVVADNLTAEQQKEFIIKDNVSGGEWDWEVLSNEWDAVDLDAWGLDVPVTIVDEALTAEEDDYIEPGTIDTDIVLGDLIEIGEHRLLCGDSTSVDAIEKLMNGEKADMVFTDPPYLIETKGGFKGDIGKALQKQCKEIEFISGFNPDGFLNLVGIVFETKKMNAYVFCNKDLLPKYLNWAVESNYSFNVLIWKKPGAIPVGGSHYPDIEYLLLFRKNAIWNNNLEGVTYSRCLEFGREKGLHPTMKPIDLISNEMKISSNAGSVVFDFFLGSGSTMVASHQLNRKCYGMELAPKYCQVIVDRMRKLDPALVVKRNGEEWRNNA
jgi:DNA modification methylase